MAWSFDPNRPIYTQLTERLRLRIASGEYPPGEKLPAVRELAAEAGANPNTVQRAFSDLGQGLRQPDLVLHDQDTHNGPPFPIGLCFFSLYHKKLKMP